MTTLRDWLSSQHPQAPGRLRMLIAWGVIWAVRRWTPGVWAVVASLGPPGGTLSHVLQGLPAAVVAALGGLALSGGDPVEALHGALWGALAPVWHHALRRLPGPYQGAVGGAAPNTLRSGGTDGP